MTVNINPDDGNSGSYTISPNKTSYLRDEFVTINAIPANKKDFSSATANTEIDVSVVQYSDGFHGIVTFYMPDYGVNVDLNFINQNRELIMGTSGDGSGTTNPSAGNYNYEIDTLVNISATPNPGSTFSGWLFGGTPDGEDGPTNQQNTQIKLSSNRSATAQFIQSKRVYANVNETGDWSVQFINTSGNLETLSGSGQLPGTVFYVACGTSVISGGFLSNEICS